MFRRFDTRIVVLFLTLLVLIQLASFAIIRKSIQRSAEGAIAQTLETAEKVLARLLEQKGTQLAESATLLAADFGFRSAIASSDAATIDDALRNQSSRIGASGALFADANLTLKASTNDDAASFLPDVREVAASSRGRQATRIVIHDNTADLLVVVPIRAPVVIGWVALHFTLGRDLLNDLRSLTDVAGSIVVRDGAEHPWRIQATILPEAAARSLPAVIGSLAHRRKDLQPDGRDLRDRETRAMDAYRQVTLESTVYGARSVSLARAGEREGAVTLMLSTDEVTAPYRQLQLSLLVLTAIGASIFGIVSWFAARRVTQPIKQLLQSAERLGSGDYDTEIIASGSDEIAELARGFEHMRVDIRSRDQRISRLAFWDELTGLPNRAQFVDRLTEAIGAARRQTTALSVLMLDVDRFKQVNDVLGHGFGDRLLNVLAQRLRQDAVRPEDLVARLGGDKFAVLLPGADRTVAEATAQRIRVALDRHVELDDQTVDLGAGIGVAIWPDHGDDASTLMAHVEAAMYSAKARQCGVVVFDPTLDASSALSLSLLTEIRHAIDCDELELHLQPKVSLETGDIVGAEALVRWRHPERGMIPPMQFVPFLEQTGQIRMLTHWVLQQSAQAWCALQAQGLSVQIAVNLSARDLMDQDFPAKLEKLLAGHRLAPGALSLEITESATMDDPQRAMQSLARIHDMGIALSIDDFGTGYSSLAYLKKLPVSCLKIDRSFVMNMEKDAADAQIVRSTIDLAHNLGLTVVAEGVETSRAWTMLRQWRCDDAQGYLIARPMPLAIFSGWVKGWQITPAEPFTAADASPRLSVV